MNCEELREFYEMYVLGVADEPECGEIRTHLNRGCEVCMGGVKRAIEMAALLGGSAPAAAPSAKLRRRILASVGFEQNRFGWAPFWAAAAVLSLVAAVYFSGRERQFAEDAQRLQEQLRAQTIDLARLNEAFAILNGPDTIVTSFGEKQPAKGRVYSNGTGVLLIANNLPSLPAGKAFEMWVIPKGAKPVPAGMFRSDANATAMHVLRRAISPGDIVAVTVENESGVNQPTSTPIIAAQMPQ